MASTEVRIINEVAAAVQQSGPFTSGGLDLLQNALGRQDKPVTSIVVPDVAMVGGSDRVDEVADRSLIQRDRDSVFGGVDRVGPAFDERLAVIILSVLWLVGVAFDTSHFIPECPGHCRCQHGTASV